jgi:anaerobic selenocysteine-containing dehydrogenase
MTSRRDFLKISAATGGGLFLATRGRFLQRALAQIPGGSLPPMTSRTMYCPWSSRQHLSVTVR